MSNSRNKSDDSSNKVVPELTKKQQFTLDIGCGLFTGAFCSGLFNPWDRGIYLSVKEHRPFLTMQNFTSPYHGFSQAVVQRAFLGSVYYMMQSQLKCYMYPYLRNNLQLNEPFTQFCIGMLAGGMSGLLTNSISAIKYHTYGQENRTFLSSIREMRNLGGYKPFIKGTAATMGRDIKFGSTYELLRHLMKTKLPKPENTKVEFLYNSSAAGVATVVAGPFNYVRNIQYATSPKDKPPTIFKALKDVCQESTKHKDRPFGRIRFFQQQFRIGWGTLRVAVGMAVGQQVFDTSRAYFKELSLKK